MATEQQTHSIELHEVLDNKGEICQIGFMPNTYTLSSRGLWEMEAFLVYPCGDCSIIPIPIFTEWFTNPSNGMLMGW